MQNKKTRVNDTLAYDRNIVEHILCLLEACRCIDIAAELGTDTAQVVEQCLVGEILCTVEAHVLKEVSKTILVIGLLESTHIGCQIELGTLGRLVVVTDVVCQAILELADSYILVNGQLCLSE